MIPKKIHYCWMSGEEYPELVKKCINSWKKIMPDYEIIEWNSLNFDYKENLYCKQAYDMKKWAFVSDYVRLKVLYEFGGIYLDSDIEVFRRFDDLLNNKAFTGFESDEIIGPWLLASEANNPIFKQFLDAYQDRVFVKEDGELDLTPNPIILSEILSSNGFENNGKFQNLNDIVIYPKQYFCPKDFSTGVVEFSPENYCIHYFNGGWLPLKLRLKHGFIHMLYQIFSKEIAAKILYALERIRCRDGR